MTFVQSAWTTIKRFAGIDAVPESGPLRQAYDAGYNAYGSGARNPHQNGTEYYRLWQRGYNEHLEEDGRAW